MASADGLLISARASIPPQQRSLGHWKTDAIFVAYLGSPARFYFFGRLSMPNRRGWKGDEWQAFALQLVQRRHGASNKAYPVVPGGRVSSRRGRR